MGSSNYEIFFIRTTENILEALRTTVQPLELYLDNFVAGKSTSYGHFVVIIMKHIYEESL